MAPKTVEGGQIWLKCITGDLIMMIRDKNNIFERVENFHADLAWNYPAALLEKNFPSRDLTTFDGWLDNSAVMIMFRVFVDSREADL